jgi:putative acetyltransferase
MIKIETPRLILRLPEEQDIGTMHAAMTENWPELQKWMSWSSNENGTVESLHNYVLSAPERAKNGDVTLTGFCKDTGAFVVNTGIGIKQNNPKEGATGYWVSKAFQGYGFATEACNAAIRYGFAKMNIDMASICYYGGNIKSRRVIEKLGFTFFRTLPLAHTSHLDGVKMDIHDYIMKDISVLPDLEIVYRD